VSKRFFGSKCGIKSPILREVQKFQKVGVLDVIFEKWFHKETFWYQVPVINPFLIVEYEFFFLFTSLDFDAQ